MTSYESFDESFDDSFDSVATASQGKQDITAEGLKPVMTAADSLGDTFLNAGKRFFLIISATGAAVDIVIKTERLIDGDLTLADQEFTIGAGERRFAGPFVQSVYNDEYANVRVTYSDETDVEIGAFELTEILD